MAKFIHTASVEFSMNISYNEGTETLKKEIKHAVFENTVNVLQNLKGYELDFLVLSEGIESKGIPIEDAESLESPGKYIALYQEFADKENCAIAGSVKLTKDGKVYNSIIFVDKGGKIITTYHKSNLTIGEIEMGLTPGKGASIADMSIGRIGGIICFDLNFEWLRKEYVRLKPDIIAFPSMYHGGLMQQIWAYECRSFFVSALPFAGGGILDPLGCPVKLTDCYNKVAKAYINLDRAIVHLDFNGKKFSEIEKKYKNKVMIQTPPNIGSAIIYSMSDEFSANDLVNEFELELLDDYFVRALECNKKSKQNNF